MGRPRKVTTPVVEEDVIEVTPEIIEPVYDDTSIIASAGDSVYIGKPKKLASTYNSFRPVLQKHAPKALLAIGIVTSVASFVTNIRATYKSHATIKRVIEDRKSFTPDDKKQIAIELAKNYAVPVGLLVVSTACGIFSYRIQSKRIAMLCSTISTLLSGANAANASGEDSLLLTAQNSSKYSEFGRFFDDSSSEWTNDPDRNLVYLRGVENYMNDQLRSRGHIFLNEVYDELGFERSSIGALVGWVYTPEDISDQTEIDFGMYDPTDKAKRMFVNGQVDSIFLNFNVQGVIYDLI